MASEPYGTDPDIPEALDLDQAAGQGGEAYLTGRTGEPETSTGTEMGAGPGPVPTSGGREDEEPIEPFFSPATAEDMRNKWRDIQATFVDDPRGALRRADELTGEVHKALSSALEERHQALVQGVTGDDTEQLRVGLRKYRQMLDQVLAL